MIDRRSLAADLASRFRSSEPFDDDAGAFRIVHAPGRVNLIGEHTDYNDGFVLPIAIDRGITIALIPTDDDRVHLTLDASGETATIDLDAIGAATGGWIDYVAGTALAMRDH